MKVSIVIPVYNEERTVRELLGRVERAPLPEGILKEIVIVDDGSSDATRERLREFTSQNPIKIIEQSPNQGKGAAVKRGIENSTGNIILIQDADLEYDPADYPALLEPILNGKAQIVYGSRFMGTIKNMTPLNRFANVMTNFTVRILFGARLTDINTCFKVFKKSTLDGISLQGKEFDLEPELTAKWLKRGLTILEVPITYTARDVRAGKKMTIRKALRLYGGLLKYWL